MSSRLIIRNLPASLTPPILREHLTHPAAVQQCNITDLKLVPKRRFAFVGYKDEEEAKVVKDWFDGTFLGSGKIKVDYVNEDALRPEPTRQPQPVSTVPSASKPLPESDEPAKPPSAAEKRLKEFMSVMKGTSDDGVIADKSTISAEPELVVQEDESKVAEDEAIDDAEWLRRRQKQASGVASVVEAGSGRAEPIPAPEASATAPAMATSSSPEEAQIATTARLFLRNLSFLTTTGDLEAVLSPFGPLLEVHLPLSTATKQPLGTAFAQFQNPVDAVAAWKQLDGKTFMGRLLHVLPGRSKKGESGVVGVEQGVEVVEASEAAKGVIGGKVLGKEVKNIKADVDKKRKEASGKGLNWATLYMNSDAVASSIADRMGIQKADILNGDSSVGDETDSRLAHMGSAVKLALAETSVIAETKKYFEDHGVLLDTLTQTSDGNAARGTTGPVRTPRSRTVLLVKNIPYGTSLDALTALFSPHGDLRRVLVPPAGTLAVVEFDEEDAASRAFKAVSYRRLGNAVIYLEKAPTGLIKADAPVGPSIPAGSGAGSEALHRVQQLASGIKAGGDADVPSEAGSTLFIKNLSWNTTTEKLGSAFSALPSFAFARVSTKPDPKNPAGPRLSMGFGFVGFKTKDAAAKAMEGLKGFKLDGHVLEFKFALRDGEDEVGKEEKGKSATGGPKSKSKTTKMIVKNLPFEASKKDIKDLFSTFGTLKSCRLPKKHNSSGRGFAFLDFATRQEAEAAMEALKHTHLLGRHLVLEWAADDEDVAEQVEKLRQKTKSQFAADEEGGPKKKKKLDLRAGGDGAEDGMTLDDD